MYCDKNHQKDIYLKSTGFDYGVMGGFIKPPIMKYYGFMILDNLCLFIQIQLIFCQIHTNLSDIARPLRDEQIIGA